MPVSLKKLTLSCASIIAVTALSACGGGGGGGSTSTTTPPPTPTADTSSPNVTFTPSTLTVESEQTGSSTLSATDNVRVTSGPTVSCTNGGSFSGSIFTAASVTANTTSVCTATASDAAGNSGTATLTVTMIPPPEPDTTAPVISFSPDTLTVVSGETATSTLSASDDVGITTGPTVSCTNGGSFSDGVFTAPSDSGGTTSVCTATAEDAAGNTASATLTVTVTAPVSAFFRNQSDSVPTQPVLGFFDFPTDPSVLVGLTKSAAGAVTSFAATSTGVGTYANHTDTPQSTLGSVGNAPLNFSFAEIDGEEGGGLPDPIFLDEVNSQLVALPLNVDNTFGLPVTRTVPSACSYGVGGSTRFVGTTPNPVRTDILVGTPSGLFYVAAGFADNGRNRSGLSAPVSIASGISYCHMVVTPSGIGDTTYVVYDAPLGLITGFEGESSDAASYTEEFTADISSVVNLSQDPLLFDATTNPIGFDHILTVFDDPQAGSKLVISDVGVSPQTIVLDLDIQNPTDMLTIVRGLSQDVILVSPTSDFAVYVSDLNRPTRTVELINVGPGIDQVEFAAGAVAFGSSTNAGIIIRTLQ